MFSLILSDDDDAALQGEKTKREPAQTLALEAIAKAEAAPSKTAACVAQGGDSDMDDGSDDDDDDDDGDASGGFRNAPAAPPVVDADGFQTVSRKQAMRDKVRAKRETAGIVVR